MFNKRSLTFGMIGVVLVVGLVSIAAAYTSMNVQVSPQAQTAKIKSITYTAGWGSSHKLDISNMLIPISIPRGYPLFLTVKGECTGPSSQKGYMGIFNDDTWTFQNAIQLTPGKVGTLKTNPPLLWFSPGYHEFEIIVCTPDGSTSDPIIIGVTVT